MSLSMKENGSCYDLPRLASYVIDKDLSHILLNNHPTNLLLLLLLEYFIKNSRACLWQVSIVFLREIDNSNRLLLEPSKTELSIKQVPYYQRGILIVTFVNNVNWNGIL